MCLSWRHVDYLNLWRHILFEARILLNYYRSKTWIGNNSYILASAYLRTLLFAIKSPLLSRLLHSFFNLIIGKFLIETDKYIRPWITSDLWRFEPFHCLNFFSWQIIPQNQNIHQFWTKLFLLFWWNFEKNGEKIRNCNPEFRIPGYKLIEWKRKIYWHWNSVFQKNPYYAYSHGTVSIYYP